MAFPFNLQAMLYLYTPEIRCSKTSLQKSKELADSGS
jgi:hypothetical protein